MYLLTVVSRKVAGKMNISYAAFVLPQIIQRFRGLPFIDDIAHMQKRYNPALTDLFERLSEKDEKVKAGKVLDEDWRVGWIIKDHFDCVPWFCLGLLHGQTLYVLPVDFTPVPKSVPAVMTCAFKDVPEMERHYGDVIPF